MSSSLSSGDLLPRGSPVLFIWKKEPEPGGALRPGHSTTYSL